MLRSLRSRLIASHVGLLVLVIPLVGLALIYVLESQIVLVNLARQLTGQAALVEELSGTQLSIWSDANEAKDFVSRVSPLFPGQLMLLSPSGTVLAASDPSDTEFDPSLTLSGLREVRRGERYSHVAYDLSLQSEIIDVMVPVLTTHGEVVGIIRVTDVVDTVAERFWRLRSLTASILAIGLVIGAFVGLILAITIERPLAQLTRAIDAYSSGLPLVLPKETGSRETRTLSRTFRRMVQRLQNLEEARQHLLANLIHELGRPLAALRAGGHALLDGAVDDLALRNELLTGMDGEIERMELLLQELAELHDRTTGHLQLSCRPTNLNLWLPPLLGPWRATAQNAGLSWRSDIAPELPTLVIDPARLGQALGNLLSNAIKYTPQGGSIFIASSWHESQWWFHVSDTGPGIPPEIHPRLFEPFFRNPPERHYPTGLGLGLTIARDIVTAHGGIITVESSVGTGSTFTVRLPATS